MNNVNAVVCFQRCNRIDDKTTTKTVDVVANDIGRYYAASIPSLKAVGPFQEIALWIFSSEM